MTTEMAARIQAVWVPVVENRLAEAGEEVGVPARARRRPCPTMALWTDVRVRLSGSRNSTAASDQYPAHTASGVIGAADALGGGRRGDAGGAVAPVDPAPRAAGARP